MKKAKGRRPLSSKGKKAVGLRRSKEMPAGAKGKKQ